MSSIRVYNNTGSAIAANKVCKLGAPVSNFRSITLGDSSAAGADTETYVFIPRAINNGSVGTAILAGSIDLNTTGFTAPYIWLNTTGDIVNVPTGGLVKLGTVDSVGASGTCGFDGRVRELKSITPDDFGAVGDGDTGSPTDNSSALQAWLDFAGADTTRRFVASLPSRVYAYATGLTITKHSTTVLGEVEELTTGPGGFSDRVGPPPTLGPCLRYTGTGVALTVGIAPTVNGNFIRGVSMRNVRIELADNSQCGLRVWHGFNTTFFNISIFGNKGNGNYGCWVQGGVDQIFERLYIEGGGQTLAGASTDYLENALRSELGYLNDVVTTTVYKNCYLRVSQYGAYTNGYAKLERCIFEACRYGARSFASHSEYIDCWFEANEVYEFQGGNGTSDVVIRGGTMKNTLFPARAAMIDPNAGFQRLVLDGVEISSAHPNPQLFPNATAILSNANAQCKLRSCLLKSTMTVGDASYASYVHTQVTDMQVTKYQFVGTGVAGTADIALVGDGGRAAYILAGKGSIVGATLKVEGYAAGSFSWNVKKNGTNVADLSYPTHPFSTSTEREARGQYFKNDIALSDLLSAEIKCSGVTGTPNVFLDVYVAYGQDGRQ